MNQEFLKPRLSGVRFEEHSIPLELLKDFAALEEMLVEVAKWKFRQANPQTKRLQRNFSKGLELHLANVEEGSAIASIVLMFAGLFPTENGTYFEQAKTEIIETIANVEQGIAPNLPPHLLSYFDRFGRGLREGEAMEFTRASGDVAKLTPAIRKKLILSSQVNEWTEEVALRGKISQIDTAKKRFQLELRDGTKINAPLNDQHLDAVFETGREYSENGYVLLQGVVRKDQQDHLKEFATVEHISPLDVLDVPLRLEELSSLKNGWLDGKGIAPAPEKLKTLASLFDSYFAENLPLPYLYPTPEGAIQAEWSVGDWEVSLEINLDQFDAEYQAVNCKDHQTSETSLQLATPDGWTELKKNIERLGGATA